jgi:hypothetical protein
MSNGSKKEDVLVSLTFDKAQPSDLLVQSPIGTQFTVDVKGQSSKNFF